MRADRRSDLPLETLDLRVQRPDDRHEGKHQLAAGGELELADPRAGGAAQPGHQRSRVLPARVPLAHKKRVHPRHTQTVSVRRAGVTLQEREQDLRVHVTEQPQRPGPKPLELCAKLVDDPGARSDEILPRPGQRPQRLGLIAVRLQHPEAVMVGARQLAQHERVKPIGLPARDPEPITRRRDLVRMQRQHPQPRIQQPLDQQPVPPLDRDQTDVQPHERPAQPDESLLVMHERRAEHLHASLVGHDHVVLLRRPIDPGVPTPHLHLLRSGHLHSAPTRRYRRGCS
jgi:hypothetical protein